ncbi:dedicator of cytokinesis protein 3-like [Labrus mixtus]|uniref:dedicator of cytokinesis protein 3-like n=1 Tax=Labrus mixtus TaxID=508554 RepID=UPI0029BFEC47|nr:dedicator of cytokinesis protein 3-like [Labrus mixtus]
MWTPTEDEKIGVVICNFRGSVTQGLALEVGETVQILEKCEGWYRGFSTRKPNVKGVFPASYIHLKKAVVTNRGPHETVVPLEDPIVTEVTSTLQEWALLWKQLYVKHKVDLFYKVRHVMMELIDLRRQLLSGHLTQDQSRDVKRHITVRLDWGNDEKFMVRLNKNGGPKNPEKVDRLCALFTDLSNKDMKRDLYIVSQVIRTGRMLLNDSKKGPPHVQYRRPYGCAVLAMSDVLQTISELKEEKDFVLKVYTCNNENEWYQIHENIIRKSSTKYTAPSTNYGLIISLQLLRGDMEQVRRENPLIFSRGVAITRKLGFPDVIMPGDIRNDLYLTLERGEFERGGKSVQKNIEVTVYVLYADGEILKDCISLGSGEPGVPEHRSFVLYHNNSPRWSEVIKLPIPIDRFRGSHLRFEFRHCSTKDKGEKKLFGFAFTPLMREDGTTLSDESHELYVYKCDENTTFSNHALYLGLPCCKEDFNSCPSIPSSLIFQRSTKETFWICTQLSSTKLTQNVDLLALLKWKAHPDRVMDILGRLRHVSGEEIVKFLQDILDTLFSILDDNTDKYGPLVFQSLVFIINLLRDSKYYHFRPVMDTYIQKHFAGALAYKELIRCLKWYMDRSAEVVRQDHIQEAMRALEYLFKFIIQSRILYSRATCGMEEEQFRTSIQELFQSIRFVLSLDSRNSETLIFTQGSQPCAGPNQAPGPAVGPAAPLALAPAPGQAPPPAPGQTPGSVQANCSQAWSSHALRPLSAALLNSFPAIFDELLQMFTVQEVAEFVRGTLGSMPSTVHIGQSMDVVKLQSIARTVDSRLFSFPESRRILLPVVLHHIHLHLRQQKELLICSGILSSIFSIIKTSSLDTSVQEEVEMMVESLLDVLLQTLLSIMSKSQSQEAVRGQRCPQCTAEITGEYVSCLLSLLRQMTDIHFQHLMENFQSKEELKEFLLKILCVFRNLMKLSIFPRDWNIMRLLTSNIILTTAQYLSPALHKNFTEAEFDFKVWNSYFSLAVLYINQPSLQLESLSAAKRKKVLDKYGDMRVMMTYELFSMWQNLGENKIHFIPGMIGPFLGVTLVPQVEVRNIMIPIFHDMMDWEQRKNGNFKQVEAELIDKLDSLVSEGKGDENYRELFSLLTQLFGPYPSLLEKIEQETWRETGISFVTSVTRLMERLLDYRDCMKGDETENKKIGCTVNLLNFYKSEINKEEMYIRYIHKLCDMHLQAENFTEAAFTLLLYWELLHWDERPLKDFLHYPAQTEWHRKEGLCRKVIHYFNKGKCWEFGIPLCRELAFQYESLYDYQSLSWIRKMEAAYYDNIMEQQRLEPEFFRVGFYGRKFPFFLRNKEFVCRGHDYERLEAFQQRMLGEFPQAIAMQHPNQPDEAILQCDAQYLQIYAVTPVPESVTVLQMDRVPDRIKSFYRVNNVRRFRYDRPFHKGPKDRDNEFKSLWIERTTLILTHPLPGISRWFEVEKRELLEVSPLENAISVVENKNQELRTLISQYQHKQLHGNINLLSMTLNGVIDAAVNGGIARYQEAFFDKEYITTHPEDTEKITQLKDLMQEQVHVLGVGLAVHEKLVHPEMRPLHKKLIDQFQMMRSSLCHGLPGLDKAGSGANTPRGILASHSPMSPESFKLLHRHSPIAVLTPVRNSSSSLSSHNSSETGNVGSLLILADGMVVENPEDFYRMQASPSSSSLSSTHSAPSQMINSAPSTIRVGSPSLPDKYRHNREMLMLLPPHRDRPSSAMYSNLTENGQPTNLQRALFHQVIGPCKPCSDPNLSVAEKVLTTPSSWSLDSGTREALPFLSAHVGSVMAPPVPPRNLPHGQHLSMHFDAFHHQVSDLPPALPARSLRKSPLHPIPASPTSPQSILDGSNSTLSGSASSGVSSLSESNFGGPASSSDPPASRTDTLESVPSSQAWTTDQEDLDSPYQPVRYSVSEPEVLDGVKPPPCRSHSAPGGVTPAQAGGQIQPQAPSPASSGAPQQQQDGPQHPQHHHFYHHHFHPHYLPHHPPLYHLHEPPPALPPKPYLREGCIPEEDLLNTQSATPPPAPRPMPRKISQPIIAATKEEQAKVAWEHGISEE